MRTFLFLAGLFATSSVSLAQSDTVAKSIRLPLIHPSEHVNLPFQGPRGLSYPFHCSIEMPPELKHWMTFSCATLRLTGTVPAGVKRGEYTIALGLEDNDGARAAFALRVPVDVEEYVRLEAEGGTRVSTAGPVNASAQVTAPVLPAPAVRVARKRQGPAASGSIVGAGHLERTSVATSLPVRTEEAAVPVSDPASAPVAGATVKLSGLTLITKPNTKTRVLEGQGQVPSADLTLSVSVCTQPEAPKSGELDCTAKNGEATLENGKKSGSPNKKGEIELLLANAPAAGSVVWLVEKGAPAGGGPAPTPVTSAVSDPVSAVARPSITGPIKAGDNPVHGSAVAAADGKTVSVQLLHKNAQDLKFTPVLEPVTTNAAGAWSVSYEAQGGELLQVEQSSTSPGLIDDSGKLSLEAVVAPVANEREHYTFVGGTLLSQTGSNFSQQNLFLAFNLDRAFYNPGWYRAYTNLCNTTGQRVLPAYRPLTQGEITAFKEAHNKQEPEGDERLVKVVDEARGPCRPNRHPGLNGFFDARLTAIPVNVSMTQPVAAAMAVTPATTMVPSAASFITSQKSARVVVGGYMPFMFGKVPTLAAHQYKETSTFYIAPIIKAGFDTLTDSTLQVASSTQVTAPGSSSVTSTPTSTLSQLGSTGQLNRLYSFATGGVRFGTATIGSGSLDTDHYLDVSFGRFSNLESLFCPTMGGCLTNGVLDPAKESRARIPRVSIEGLFRIPTTGFIIGISANIGQNTLLKPQYGDPNNRAVDDLRFLFGYKVDINKLVQHFPQVF